MGGASELCREQVPEGLDGGNFCSWCLWRAGAVAGCSRRPPVTVPPLRSYTTLSLRPARPRRADEKHGNGADTYLHRVGRAGRFGTKGLAITFVASPADSEVLNQVQVGTTAPGAAAAAAAGGSGWATRAGPACKLTCIPGAADTWSFPGKNAGLTAPGWLAASVAQLQCAAPELSPCNLHRATDRQPPCCAGCCRSGLMWTSSRCQSTLTPAPT